MTRQDSSRSFDLPSRDCDVVLKGGVTSGIVYPLALCELATTYQFRRIGGTSSGAIVAAFAAAAEYARQAPEDNAGQSRRRAVLDGRELEPGFRGLEQFAKKIQEPDKLLSVFLPDPATKPIFDALLAGHLERARGREAELAGKTETIRPALRTILTLWSHVPKGFSVAGVIIAMVAMLALIWPMTERIAGLVHQGGLHRLGGDMLALLLLVMVLAATVAGALIGAVWSLVRMVLHDWIPTFVNNGFGLTRGLGRVGAAAPKDAPDEDGAEPYALTTWMTRIINELAGREALGDPLTFGDLWCAKGGSATNRTIGFELITTCLTLGRPLRLPDDLDCDPPFYFNPDEWLQYFPRRVVDHLIKHSPHASRERDPDNPDGKTRYYRLPKAAHLPIVVATRLSVSLPVVLSAVPLWSVDMNTRRGRDQATMPLERTWFSDGGIGSNFPVHFFDSLIPRWPTFAIDLRAASDAYPLDGADETKNVWMPLTNEQGRTEWWSRFDTDQRPGEPQASPVAARGVMQFGGAIVNTMWSWRDNTLAHETGFRDRIVHVKLNPQTEGGLNLAMPPLVIQRLTERGAAAGALLKHRYTITENELAKENCERRETAGPHWQATTVSWENHRWLRFRTAMAALQESLERLDDTYSAQPGYEPLVVRPHDHPPHDFQWSAAQRHANPAQATAELLGAIRAWRKSTPEMRFDAGALPAPRPELRMWPRV